MPAKSADLRRAILDQAGRDSAGTRARAAAPADAAPDPARRAAQPGRIGKVSVTGYFAPEVRRQLKRLAADADTTVQALLGEALNDLFAKHGLAEIADSDTEC